MLSSRLGYWIKNYNYKRDHPLSIKWRLKIVNLRQNLVRQQCDFSSRRPKILWWFSAKLSPGWQWNNVCITSSMRIGGHKVRMGLASIYILISSFYCSLLVCGAVGWRDALSILGWVVMCHQHRVSRGSIPIFCIINAIYQCTESTQF